LLAVPFVGPFAADFDALRVYGSGAAPVYRTLSASSTTNVTLSSAVSQPAVGDAVYEISLQGKIVVAGSLAGAGTNTLGNYAGELFVTPGDSPLYMTMDGATNTCLSATVEK
jgi:hypothetical protein